MGGNHQQKKLAWVGGGEYSKGVRGCWGAVGTDGCGL